MINRLWISQHYMKGHGIDIGAFNNPFPVFTGQSTIDYLDCRSLEDQKKAITNLDYTQVTVVTPHLIDDGEILSTIPNESYDFLCSSHQLEHCQSALTALENQLRIVKKGGYLFYALPDKRDTFDHKREVTPWNHFLVDYYSDPRRFEGALSDMLLNWKERLLDHYDEYLLNVDGIENQQERLSIGEERISKGLDIHFHTFDSNSMYHFFQHAKSIIGVNYQVELFYRMRYEMFIVLKKEEVMTQVNDDSNLTPLENISQIEEKLEDQSLPLEEVSALTQRVNQLTQNVIQEVQRRLDNYGSNYKNPKNYC